MDDYISRQAAIDEMRTRQHSANEWYVTAKSKDDEKIIVRADSAIVSFIECILTLEKLPSADVQPVRHGRWIYGKDDETGELDTVAWTCSLCGEKYPWQPNYCPICGARMDGEQHE